MQVTRRHILVITQLDLTTLAVQKHGIYQRLHAYMLAASQLDMRITLLVVRPQDAKIPSEVLAERTVRSVAEHWGCEVEAVVANDFAANEKPKRLLALLSLCSYGFSYPGRLMQAAQKSPKVRQVLQGDYAIVLAHRLPPALLTRSMGGVRTPRVVFDVDDIEHVKEARSRQSVGPSVRGLATRIRTWALMRAELGAVRRASAALVCSKSDESYLRSRGVSNAYVLPNAVPLPESALPLTGSKVMLMVGQYSYGPNAAGITRFVRQVLPMIQASEPRAELWIAGAGSELLPEDVKSAAGVRLLGFVDDLSSCYGAAEFAVCPIYAGGGTRIKILEAAAFGRATVSTAIGAEGLSLEDGKAILLAEDDVHFARNCLQLLSDAQLNNRIALSARSTVRSIYSRESQIGALAGLLSLQIDVQSRDTIAR